MKLPPERVSQQLALNNLNKAYVIVNKFMFHHSVEKKPPFPVGQFIAEESGVQAGIRKQDLRLAWSFKTQPACETARELFNEFFNKSPDELPTIKGAKVPYTWQPHRHPLEKAEVPYSFSVTPEEILDCARLIETRTDLQTALPGLNKKLKEAGIDADLVATSPHYGEVFVHRHCASETEALALKKQVETVTEIPVHYIAERIKIKNEDKKTELVHYLRINPENMKPFIPVSHRKPPAEQITFPKRDAGTLGR